jgi:hypothetical protein
VSEIAPPRGLSARSRRLWRAVLAEFELSDAELAVLREALVSLDRADAAAAVVVAEGVLTRDRYGCWKANPATDVELRNRSLFARLIAQLGVKEPAVESQRTKHARRAAQARWSNGTS